MRLIKRLTGPVILLLIAITMLGLSWQKWADALIDFGRELYVPWQINQGSVLYKDITHLYGPLPHYFNALLFRLFGTGLATLAVFNIALILLLTSLIYLIFLRTASGLSAIAAGAVFLSIFAFSQYVYVANYNFVCPYCHEITHGVILSFLCILAFMQYVKELRTVWLWVIGLVLGLVFLTKAEVFIAILSAVVVGEFFLIVVSKPKLSEIIKTLSSMIIGFIIPIAFFVVYFLGFMPISEAVKSIFLQYSILVTSSIPSNIFYRKSFGVDDPIRNLAALASALSLYLFAFAVLFLVANIMKRIRRKRYIRIFKIFVISALLLLLAPVIFYKTPWYEMARPLPLFAMAFGIYMCRMILKRDEKGEGRNKAISLLVVSMFSFVLLFKMVLNSHVYHYGFALSMPAALLLTIIILDYVPEWIGEVTGGRGLVRTLALILVVIAIMWHVVAAAEVYALKTYAVGTGPDLLMEFRPDLWSKGRYIDIAVRRLKEMVRPDETLVAFPEGVILNYMARRKNPTPYFEFTPPIISALGEEIIVKSMTKHRPDYLALVDKDTSEHGYRYFGLDYGMALSLWIKDNYSSVCTIGEKPFSGKGFGITIMKRSSAR